MPVPHELLVPIFACFLVAGIIKGLTGIGFLTVCTASLVFLVDLKTAISLTLIASFVSNLTLMAEAGGFVAIFRHHWKIYAAAVPGLLLGVHMLLIANEALLLAGLAAVVISFSVFSMTQPKFELGQNAARMLEMPVGFLYGAIAGLTGSHVMPLVPFALSIGLDRNQYTQLVNSILTLGTIVIGLSLWQEDVFTGPSLSLSALCVIPTFVGASIGSAIRRRVTSELFRTATLVTLSCVGLSLAARAAQALGL